MFNKTDLAEPDASVLQRLSEAKIPVVQTVAAEGHGILDLRRELIQAVPEEFLSTPPLVADLVPPGEMAVLVVPIDLEAPKGRLIVPRCRRSATCWITTPIAWSSRNAS